MNTTPDPELYRLMFDAVPPEALARHRELAGDVFEAIERQVAADTAAELARIEVELERLLVNGGDPAIVHRPGWLTGPVPAGTAVVEWSDLSALLVDRA